MYLIAVLISVFAAKPYSVPSYYGHFSLDYFLPQFITQGKLVRVEYHFGVDFNYANTTTFQAIPSQHCVYKYDLITRKITVLIGKCGKPGNIVGNTKIARLNGASSVAFFQPRLPSPPERIIIVANANCKVNTDPSCVLRSDAYPANLTINNLRMQPDTSIFSNINTSADSLLYIADRDNHCIKRLNLNTNLVDVVAGLCGIPGFQDGPFGFNRLSFPSNLGVSAEGVIYFFDSGNSYIRIVNGSNFVMTLHLGACKEYMESRTLQKYTLIQMLCYENWIEGKTHATASQQHYFNESIISICIEHASMCP